MLTCLVSMRIQASDMVWALTVFASALMGGALYATRMDALPLAICVLCVWMPVLLLRVASRSEDARGWKKACLRLAAIVLFFPALAGVVLLCLSACMGLILIMLHPWEAGLLLAGAAGLGAGAYAAGRGYRPRAAALALAAGAAIFLLAAPRLRAKCDSDGVPAVKGWRFRIEGPETGPGRRRLYVPTGEPTRPFKPVFECPQGTVPKPGYPEEVGAGGQVCRPG